MGENVEQVSKIINYEFSESGDFVDITTRLCYLNDYNLNGFKLKTNEEDEEKTKQSVATLVNTPVVAYYNSKKDDFEGHKVVKTKDGTIKFGTQAVGTHTEAWIENDKVVPVFSDSDEEIELPCIFGKARIWGSRFPKYYGVLKKRLKKEQMYTSWELNPITLVEDTDVENTNVPNPRSSDEWLFLGNCLLGTSDPAYGKNSKVLETSSIDDFDIELSEALSEDILTLSENDEDVNINNKQGGNEVVSENNKEVSALTENDLYTKVRRAVNSVDSKKYFYMSMIFPYEYKAIAYEWDRESQLDFVEFTYSANSDDTISVTAQKNVQMVFMPKEELDNQISELNTKLSDKEKEVSEKVESINKLGDEISTLQTQVSELTPFKEEHDKVVAEKEAQELAEKKENLKQFAMKGGYISQEEIESSEEIKEMIENLNESALKVMRAERIEKKIEEMTASSTKEQKTETSTANTDAKTVKSDLNSEDEGFLSATDIVKMMVKKNK